MTDLTALLRDYLPALASDDPAALQVLARGRVLTLPAGQAVFRAGAPCEHYLLVLQGRVRVQVIGEGGREAVLYRVADGQSCVLTTCCILSGEDYPAEGHTETEVRALVLTRADFDRTVESVPAFRRFVFENLGRRLAEVIVRMEEVAFQPVERRLAAYVLAHAGVAGAVNVTHQAIALELGTAREVVSRHLKRLEGSGLVRLGRSTVEVLDARGLQLLAGGPL